MASASRDDEFNCNIGDALMGIGDQIDDNLKVVQWMQRKTSSLLTACIKGAKDIMKELTDMSSQLVTMKTAMLSQFAVTVQSSHPDEKDEFLKNTDQEIETTKKILEEIAKKLHEHGNQIDEILKKQKTELAGMDKLLQWDSESGTSGYCSDNAQETKSLQTSVFIPETYLENKNRHTYRFQCPHAGVFQCKITNLVFEMEDKGEVLYRIVSWDMRLMDGLGHMQPAGPLYNIDCFEGSVSHLHLPHCEIALEKQVELDVAHFTCDNVEVIKPVKVTDTHVIVAISGLSLFGLLLDTIFPARHINAQILFFCKPITGRQNLKQLNIHLLPGNVPVKEVQNHHMDFKHINTSSSCVLIPGKNYRPSCDHHTPEPEADHVKVSLLDENKEEVWKPHQLYLTGCTESPLLSVDAGAAFVNTHREELIQRVSSVMEIADGLQSKSMISDEMYSSIQAARTSQERMRILYQALTSGGRAVEEEFYGILKQKQPFLLKELESGPT
ncbi:NACHT, LRR and PYD domains-containing protein 1b allele 3-like isoform X2 [Brachyhypopomus gauderio]|uniref:NACHT, LRR and PYD domains-containing protein 1b allele 3-like isoform X2 n=1 Tax=Brachyhypopomus gauderio TaxID=698409 RepID=UPI0040421EBC